MSGDLFPAACYRYLGRSEMPVDDRFLYVGFIRLHLLHHASQEPIYGLAMMEELARHGYRLSAGTLYPILHGLETKGYLTSERRRAGKSVRRVYRATPAGRKALKAAKLKVSELFGEMFEDDIKGRDKAIRRGC
jgi:PadR family transcriptional regulator